MPKQQRVFNYLEELNFSFNVVDEQSYLFYCANQLPNLKLLIVTGNPFAITGEEANYLLLQSFLQQKGGFLVNETLNGPTYLKRGGMKALGPPLTVPPMMITQNGE